MTHSRLLRYALLASLLANPLAWAEEPAAPAVQSPADGEQILQEFRDQQEAFTLIDARTPDEFSAGHVAGAVNIPHDQLDAHLAELPQDKSAPVLVYCRTGRRAGMLVDALAQRGYTQARVLPADGLVFDPGS